jgi:hypothetical protein
MVRAATPVMCGVAIDVPESISVPVPVPIPAETTFVPGAVMSGLRRASGVRGPAELKEAIPVTMGVPSARLTVAPSASARLLPSEFAVFARPLTPKNGMVTLYCSPVSGFEVIGPSNGGRLVELLIITTAAAPAFWPKTARATRAQVPR